MCYSALRTVIPLFAISNHTGMKSTNNPNVAGKYVYFIEESVFTLVTCYSRASVQIYILLAELRQHMVLQLSTTVCKWYAWDALKCATYKPNCNRGSDLCDIMARFRYVWRVHLYLPTARH